jgi:hypothetical protein
MCNPPMRRLAAALFFVLTGLAGYATTCRAQVMYSSPHYGAWTVDPMPPVYREHWKARPAFYGSLPRGRSAVVSPVYVPYPEGRAGTVGWPVDRGPWVPKDWLIR